MRGSNKEGPPPELEEWLKVQSEAGLSILYGDLAGEPRTCLIERLSSEQTGLCVYCGRALDTGINQTYHVEHFRPRSKYGDLQLDHNNLFLSCGPQSERGSDRETCGRKKGNTFSEDKHINPVPDSCSSFFRYLSNGKVSDVESESAVEMINVLGLNDPELMREREELIQGIDAEIFKSDIPPLEFAETWKVTNEAGNRVSFSNVAMRYLEEF